MNVHQWYKVPIWEHMYTYRKHMCITDTKSPYENIRTYQITPNMSMKSISNSDTLHEHFLTDCITMLSKWGRPNCCGAVVIATRILCQNPASYRRKQREREPELIRSPSITSKRIYFKSLSIYQKTETQLYNVPFSSYELSMPAINSIWRHKMKLWFLWFATTHFTVGSNMGCRLRVLFMVDLIPQFWSS